MGSNAADTEPVAPAPATCTGCFSQVRRPLTSIYCPHCGHTLVEPKELPKHSKEQAKIDKELARELAKMEKEQAKKDAAAQRKAEEHACNSLEELVALAKSRGYRYANAWAENMWARWKQRGIVARKRAVLHDA